MVLNESDILYATGATYKGKLFIYMLDQTIRMMMCITASNHQPNAKILPGDSFDKAMLQMQRLQASRPAGWGIYIVKEIPKKLEISLRFLKFLFLRNRSKISNYDLQSLGFKFYFFLSPNFS